MSIPQKPSIGPLSIHFPTRDNSATGFYQLGIEGTIRILEAPATVKDGMSVRLDCHGFVMIDSFFSSLYLIGKYTKLSGFHFLVSVS